MNSLNSKLPDTGTTIFSIMSKMASDYEAINLSQGFPDFEVAPELISLVNEEMLAGHNQYAPMPGHPLLRSEIASLIKRQYQINIDPEEEITVTTGATEGLFCSIAALVQPGDEVIVFDPAYDSYEPAILLQKGIPVHIPLAFPSYNIDWQLVKEKITNKTKVIIINSPHNPTGSILSKEDMQELERIAIANNLYIISDEVYEHIIFDDLKHHHIHRFPALSKRSISISSFGKTLHATGWKMGYTIAPPILTKEIRKIHQYLTFSVNTPIQLALAKYLSQNDVTSALSNFFKAKRDHFLSAMSDSKFTPLPSHGTYFQLFSYEKIASLSDVEMAEFLTKEIGVASIPISVFYQNKTDRKVLRFCFAKNESTLNQAAELLCKI